VGDLNDALDQFRSQQRQLWAAEANLAQQQHQSQAAADSTDQARQQALAAAADEQAQLDQLQSQLSRYVEAAAVAAQHQAAANAAAAAAAARSAAASATSGTQGLPVNHGLESVVHSIVTTPAPTPAPAPAPAPAPRPAPAPAPPRSSGYVDAGGVWLQLRLCESSDNYAENTGNGFYGAYQFSAATWSGLGFPGRPDLESHQMQDQAAMRLQAQGGWGQWPACSAALGLR
jgi:hypothetical protein